MKTTLFFKPDCSKCQQAKDLLEEASCEIEFVEYLTNTPTEAEIRHILTLLNIPAEDLIRKGETIFKTHFEGKTLSEQDWIRAMIDFPILIERPIVIHGNKAIIGRPPSKVLGVL